MVDHAKKIRRELKSLEKFEALIDEMRAISKTDGGRMTEFGRGVIEAARDNGIKQALIAKFFDITPGAVSQHYNK